MKRSKVATMSMILFFGLCALCFSADLTGIWDVTADTPGQTPETNRLLILQQDDNFTYAGLNGKIRNGKYLILGPLPERKLVRGVWVQVDKISFVPSGDDKFNGKVYMSVYDFKESTRKVFSTDVMLTGVRVVDAPPILSLLGDKEIWIAKGSDYADPGAVAFEETGNNISDKIVVKNTVDADTCGTYTITYNVVGNNNKPAEEVSRTVHVVTPGPPVLTMKGDAEVSIQKGSAYVDSGATAVNFLNKDITDQIKTLVNGEAKDPNTIDITKAKTVYNITYTVEDENGSSQAKRTVTVMQREDEQSFFKYCFISHLMN